MAHLTLYRMACEKNKVDKTSDLTQVAQIVGTFRSSVNVRTPSITMTSNRLTFNYVYIQELHRYYFVTDITMASNSAFIVSLREDVLMTFKDSIKAQTALIERNENDYNPYLNDPLFLAEIEKNNEIKDLTDSMIFNPYANGGHSICLIGVK